GSPAPRRDPPAPRGRRGPPPPVGGGSDLCPTRRRVPRGCASARGRLCAGPRRAACGSGRRARQSCRPHQSARVYRAGGALDDGATAVSGQCHRECDGLGGQCGAVGGSSHRTVVERASPSRMDCGAVDATRRGCVKRAGRHEPNLVETHLAGSRMGCGSVLDTVPPPPPYCGTVQRHRAERRQAMTSAAIYTVETFIEDVRQIFATTKDPRTQAQEVARHMQELLRAPGWLEERLQLPAEGGFGRHDLHYDAEFGHPEGGFLLMCGIQRPGQDNLPHDHGTTWVVYGVYQGAIEQTKWRGADPATDRTAPELKPLESWVQGPGDIA